MILLKIKSPQGKRAKVKGAFFTAPAQLYINESEKEQVSRTLKIQGFDYEIIEKKPKKVETITLSENLNLSDNVEVKTEKEPTLDWAKK